MQMENEDAPRVPAATRVYAVGDIHGCVDLLADLHHQILEDADAAGSDRRVVVYLGDYVDRGPASARVTEVLLADPLPGFEVRALKGNHEDMLLRFLDGQPVGETWLSNGGTATLASYGIDAPSTLSSQGVTTGLEALRREFQEAIPATHLAFYRDLVLMHREGDYVFVHAGVRPGRSLAEQGEEDLMWIRQPFLVSEQDFGAVIVHGHSIDFAPQVRPNRIGIDTGAFATGRLTCLVLEGSERSFLST